MSERAKKIEEALRAWDALLGTPRAKLFDELKRQTRAALSTPAPKGGIRRCPDCGSTYFNRDGAKALDEATADGYRRGVEDAARVVGCKVDRGWNHEVVAEDIRKLALAPPTGRGRYLCPECARSLDDHAPVCPLAPLRDKPTGSDDAKEEP